MPRGQSLKMTAAKNNAAPTTKLRKSMVELKTPKIANVDERPEQSKSDTADSYLRVSGGWSPIVVINFIFLIHWAVCCNLPVSKFGTYRRW